MNKLDLDYQNLLKDILENGVKKKTRNGEVLSVFGRQIRHSMKNGFPVLTTKKMAWKSVVTELLWFLRGDTNIKYLVDNECYIWNGDSYKNYLKVEGKKFHESTKELRKWATVEGPFGSGGLLRKEDFANKIKTDDEFAKKWGELGRIYGAQWRSWAGIDVKMTKDGIPFGYKPKFIDQIANLINDLKTNPDSRRLMVSAWNVADLEHSVLPPCHYGFQLYTRELSLMERKDYAIDILGYESLLDYGHSKNEDNTIIELMNEWNVPTRTISLMYNARSQDLPLGTPFNIASYALLLEILGKIVNMIPDELITNMGDCHIYTNQIEGVKEHIGRDLNLSERIDFWFNNNKPNRDVVDDFDELSIEEKNNYLNKVNVPKKTREPFELPKLQHQKTDEFYKSLSEDLSLLTHLEPNDFVLKNYKSHSKINFPLSN